MANLKSADSIPNENVQGQLRTWFWQGSFLPQLSRIIHTYTCIWQYKADELNTRMRIADLNQPIDFWTKTQACISQYRLSSAWKMTIYVYM